MDDDDVIAIMDDDGDFPDDVKSKESMESEIFEVQIQIESVESEIQRLQRRKNDLTLKKKRLQGQIQKIEMDKINSIDWRSKSEAFHS